MYAVSSRWDTAIRGSGQKITRVDIFNRWDTGLSRIVHDGTKIIDNALVKDVSITIDRNAEHWRTASMTLVDPDFLAIFNARVPNLFGLEFDISMGVGYGDGTEELVPMGRFSIQQADYLDGDGAIHIQLVDRSFRFMLYKEETTQTYQFNSSVATIVENFMYSSDFAGFHTDVLNLIQGYFMPGPSQVVTKIREPLPYINTVLGISSAAITTPSRAYFGPDGWLRDAQIQAVPPGTPVSAANYTFTRGAAGNLSSATVAIQFVGFVNNSIVGPVMNDATGAISTARFWMTGSAMGIPTGPAGWRTVVNGADPSDYANISTIATNILYKGWGFDRRISIEGLANPALEAGDYVSVELSDGEVVLQALESMTIDSTFSAQLETSGERVV